MNSDPASKAGLKAGGECGSEDRGNLRKPCGFKRQEIDDCGWSQFPLEMEREIRLEKAEDNFYLKGCEENTLSSFDWS